MQEGDAPYTSAYFEGHLPGSLRSARAILPLVVDIVEVRSAIDVGCGVGTWVSVLRELGVEDVVGVDGPYVDRSQLLFPESLFIAHDLTEHLHIRRTFDLALSLEVAEHLPAARAQSFVETLTGLAPVVLFSSAIPGQGGIDHINERWPDYWVDLFARYDYVAIDALRHLIWSVPEIEPYYAQNILLFVSPGALAQSPRLQRELDRQPRLLDIVHPRIFEIHRKDPNPPTVRELLQQLPRAVFRALGIAGTRTRLVQWLRGLRGD